MNTYSREEVVAITQPDPNWMNFPEPVVYEKHSITLSEAVKTLYTVLDDIEDFERVTFEEYAKAYKENKITDIPPDRLHKIEDLYQNKYSEELSIPCFMCGDLKKLLPEEYPSWIKTPDSAYVVEDGNHRLISMAIRLLEGEKIGNRQITVFYGRLAD